MKALLGLSIVAMVIISGCVTIPFEETPVGDFVHDDSPFFLHITDLHIGAASDGFGYVREGNLQVLDVVVTTINEMENQPLFVIVSGDVGHYTGGISGAKNLRDAKTILEKLYAPYFVVPGNHDYLYGLQTSIPHSLSNYLEVFGDPDRTVPFEVDGKDAVIMFIDSGRNTFEDPAILTPESTGLTAAQFTDIESTMTQDYDYKFIAMHHPIMDVGDLGNEAISNYRDELVQLCIDNEVNATFSGHSHRDVTLNSDGLEWNNTDGTKFIRTANMPSVRVYDVLTSNTTVWKDLGDEI